MAASGNPSHPRKANASLKKHHRAIGTFVGDSLVDIDYPLAFCRAMIQLLPAGKRFTYVHLGGGFTEPPDSDRSLWYYAKARRVRVCYPVVMIVHG